MLLYFQHVPSLGYMMSENYLAGPPPRIPGNLIGRPRLPPLKLPVYNNRTIPTFKKSDSDVPASTANTSSTANTATTANIPTTSSAPSSTITTNVTGNTTEEVG